MRARATYLFISMYIRLKYYERTREIRIKVVTIAIETLKSPNSNEVRSKGHKQIGRWGYGVCIRPTSMDSVATGGT